MLTNKVTMFFIAHRLSRGKVDEVLQFGAPGSAVTQAPTQMNVIQDDKGEPRRDANRNEMETLA
jgi:hypothetical protein